MAAEKQDVMAVTDLSDGAGRESNVEDLNGDLRCPDCGSFNVEENDPRPGEHTCRDCGGWLD